MPFAIRDGVRLYSKLEGAAGSTPLVLLNSIGTDMSLWDLVVPVGQGILLLRERV